MTLTSTILPNLELIIDWGEDFDDCSTISTVRPIDVQEGNVKSPVEYAVIDKKLNCPKGEKSL